MTRLEDLQRSEMDFRKGVTQALAAFIARDGGKSHISFEELENVRDAEVIVSRQDWVGMGEGEPGVTLSIR